MDKSFYDSFFKMKKLEKRRVTCVPILSFLPSLLSSPPPKKKVNVGRMVGRKSLKEKGDPLILLLYSLYFTPAGGSLSSLFLRSHKKLENDPHSKFDKDVVF